MRYFDTHVHLLPPRRLRSLIRWVKRAFPTHPVSETATIDEIVAEMRQSGAEYIVNLVFPLNVGEAATLHEFNAQLAAQIPNLLPFAGVHIEDEDRVEQIVFALDDLGFVGLKIHTMVQHVDPWDKRLHPVYAELERRQKPLWLHTGFEYIYDFAFPDDHLRHLAERFPGMPIVLAHAIFPRLAEAFKLADEYPNIYLDMTNVFGILAHAEAFSPKDISENVAQLVEIAQRGLETHVGRVVFGTDHPAGLGNVEQILTDMYALEIPEEARQAMLYDTPQALFTKWAGERMAEKNADATPGPQLASQFDSDGER